MGFILPFQISEMTFRLNVLDIFTEDKKFILTQQNYCVVNIFLYSKSPFLSAAKIA